MTGQDGPTVVALGGGRGLSATLRAVRTYAGFTHAVVSTADDGGSTGRLRRAMEIPAPGDLRRSLVALAGSENLPIGEAMEFRFAGTDLEGHALGNLLLVGLTAVTGDFSAATNVVSQIVGLDPRHGRVWPATTEPVVLHATTTAGNNIIGQYTISKTAGIASARLEPECARSPAGLKEVIQNADQIVLGPGSVYTSVLACALVEDVKEALTTTDAQIVYVCNLAPEDNETAGYDAYACIAAIRRHGIEPDVVITDRSDSCDPTTHEMTIVTADVSSTPGGSHDSRKLADVLRTVAATKRVKTKLGG